MLSRARGRTSERQMSRNFGTITRNARYFQRAPDLLHSLAHGGDLRELLFM
jgi:hypothetical protein